MSGRSKAFLAAAIASIALFVAFVGFAAIAAQTSALLAANCWAVSAGFWLMAFGESRDRDGFR